MNHDEIKKSLFEEYLITKDPSKLNQYYQENPPQFILDEDTVVHFKEVNLPAKYEHAPCKCGMIHTINSNTWYHKPMTITVGGEISIYRACKLCQDFLMKKLVND